MESEDGSWSGNPLSDFVAQYMKSLKRRKVSTDCTLLLMNVFLTGSCFLDTGWRDQTLLVENILTAQAKKKYAAELHGFHLKLPARLGQTPITSSSLEELRSWGDLQLLLPCFLDVGLSRCTLCLLRLDEVLRIEACHIYRERIDQGYFLKPTKPEVSFRKTKLNMLILITL